jgi:glycerol-3-phosphate dehydrogenase (NAD(P)+)
MTRVAVIGATSWGTTLAVLMARNGAEVTLCARTRQEAQALDSKRESPRRPGLKFPESMRVSADVKVINEAPVVVLGVTSSTLQWNLDRIVPHTQPVAAVLSAVKGIEPGTGRRMSELIEASGVEPGRLLALSGPNFAGEIASGLPAATVVASPNAKLARDVQTLLSGPTFRVYTSDDIAGVELGGALKNVVAIACGISDGLGYGENAKAALITRALAEITRLGVAAGARPLTFLGLAGMGDLILSCESDISRNRRLGLALAKGASVEEAMAGIDGVVEGAVTARAIPVLALRYGVELPICAALYAVLYEGLAPSEAAQELMSRASRPELDGLS